MGIASKIGLLGQLYWGAYAVRADNVVQQVLVLVSIMVYFHLTHSRAYDNGVISNRFNLHD